MPNNIHSDQPSDFSNELKTMRPDLRKRHLYCVKCRKEPRAMESTAMHRSATDGLPSGQGIILVRVWCHGDIEELAIGFQEAAQIMESGEKIPVFDSVNKREPKRILGPDGLLRE